MIATNHALTGAVIGFSISQPLLAIPLALISHFICDAIPHYGSANVKLGTVAFNRLLYSDIAICVLLVGLLAAMNPTGWLLAAVCAFIATSPDLMWLSKYVKAEKGLVAENYPTAIHRFHANIQWFERPTGLLVEVAWAVAAIILLKVYLF